MQTIHETHIDSTGGLLGRNGSAGRSERGECWYRTELNVLYVNIHDTEDPKHSPSDQAVQTNTFRSFATNFGRSRRVEDSRKVADTGSTLSLMSLTLMALGVAARQFKRAAA